MESVAVAGTLGPFIHCQSSVQCCPGIAEGWVEEVQHALGSLTAVCSSLASSWGPGAKPLSPPPIAQGLMTALTSPDLDKHVFEFSLTKMCDFFLIVVFTFSDYDVLIWQISAVTIF